MSLILEALKKAERQHKLGEVPRISAQLAEQSGHGKHRLGLGLLSILALGMLGVGIYLGSMQNTPQPEPEARIQTRSEPEVTRPPGELSVRPEPRPQNGASAPAAELPSRQVEPLAVESRPETDQVKSEITVDKPVPERPAPVQPPPPKARQLNEMPSGFVSNLPAMNIDIHSYDPHPAKRYVLINMEKYHEGDYLAEGPNLIEIRPDGVVMEHMGERFILPLGTP